MKKNYSKPEIVFESFKVTTSIASSCANKINADIDSCEVSYGWDVVFSEKNTDCTLISNDSIECYHVSSDTPNVFGS